jgi:hypothetical protein
MGRKERQDKSKIDERSSEMVQSAGRENKHKQCSRNVNLPFFRQNENARQAAEIEDAGTVERNEKETMTATASEKRDDGSAAEKDNGSGKKRQ